MCVISLQNLLNTIQNVNRQHKNQSREFSPFLLLLFYTHSLSFSLSLSLSLSLYLSIYLSLSIYIYIYIHLYICVSVIISHVWIMEFCLLLANRNRWRQLSHLFLFTPEVLSIFQKWCQIVSTKFIFEIFNTFFWFIIFPFLISKWDIFSYIYYSHLEN